MTQVDTPVRDRLPRKAPGPLSMISLLAISAGIAAAPAQAQDMTASPAPVQAPPVISLQPAPASPPTTIAPATTTRPVAGAEPAPTVAPTRVDDLATTGGFDASTVAPEALAQIEREQQARKDAAAAAATSAAAARAAQSAQTSAGSAPVTDSATPAVPAFDAKGSATLAEGAGAVEPVAAIRATTTAPQFAVAPEAMPADGEADWNLLAALAAMLGIGSAGAYAATRRRRSKTRQAAALNAAIMPELRTEPAGTGVRPTIEHAPAPAQPTEEDTETVKMELAEFVASLPTFEAPRGKPDRNVKLGQRRVPAAPRPYLGEADLTRPAGYFTAHVDAMPTPQNPFPTPTPMTNLRHMFRDSAFDSVDMIKALPDVRLYPTDRMTVPTERSH